ncbi:MAG: hypothetical protein IPJ07_07430 [Acidobacteria bacterium]|nr:hypothetical protein [Acidobacteriota bacterium]
MAEKPEILIHKNAHSQVAGMQKLKEKIRQGNKWVKGFYGIHKAIIWAILGGVLIGLFYGSGLNTTSLHIVKTLSIKNYPSLTANERVQIDREMLKAENEARTTLAQIIGGIGLLAGLYFTWRSLKINEDGKITDRYSKAIELLGSKKKNLDMRLGGIYALERIARDSEKDHWTVMEALTAFIREHSPVKANQKGKQGELFKSEDEKRITTDIQAALTVIGRRKWIEQEKEKTKDLTSAWPT